MDKPTNGDAPNRPYKETLDRTCTPSGCLSSSSAHPTTRHSVKVAAAQTPEIFVFDSFSSRIVDLNVDGFTDIDHGELIAIQIRAQTGIEPRRVEIEGKVKPTVALDALLARKDVSNLYLNFSVLAGNDPLLRQQLYALAQRGAHIYIAAGNDDPNQLAVSTKPHPNIHIVGASTGVVGGPASTRLATLRIKNLTETTNGVINPTKVSGGFDINQDGKADVSTQLVKPIPLNAQGQRLVDVDITSRAVKAKALTGFNAVPNNAVASIKALKQQGLIDDLVLGEMRKSTGLNQSQLDGLFVHVHHLVVYQNSLGDNGGLVLYRSSTAGRLALVQQKPSTTNTPASSWATPNALSRDVNTALRKPH